VNSAADLVADEHFRANGSLIAMNDPELGALVGPGVIPRLSETPGAARHTGHWTLGHDNDAVYGDLLGLDADARAALTARRVI
jgi:formyl-CoA transferase